MDATAWKQAEKLKAIDAELSQIKDRAHDAGLSTARGRHSP